MALQRRTRSTRLLMVTLVTASLVTITVDYKQGPSGPLATLGKSALTVITPLQEGVTKAFRPVASFFEALVELPSIKEERDALRNQVKELESEQSLVANYQNQIQQLESNIGLRDTLGLETIGARVIGYSPSNFEWSITIDQGSNDGIETNMSVVGASGPSAGLVGRVTEVTPWSAKVTLIVDPESEVGGRLVTSAETGVVHGRGPEDPVMEFVDVNTAVDVGEPVVTDGFDGSVFPPDIPIGVVTEVASGPADLAKEVTVEPAVDFSTLFTVLVVTGPSSG